MIELNVAAALKDVQSNNSRVSFTEHKSLGLPKCIDAYTSNDQLPVNKGFSPD